MVFGLLSLAVVLGEATISPQLPNLSLFSRALHSLEGDQTMTEIACFAFLAYPVACAYYGLYKCASCNAARHGRACVLRRESC